MEQYVSQLVIKNNEENAVKEYFALGSSRYISTYELSENHYLLYSFLQSRSICILDYRDNLLIAPARRAINPLLRGYAEREELEFSHGQLGRPKGTVISTIKLRHPPTVDDSQWFKELKLKVNERDILDDYIQMAGSMWSEAAELAYGSMTTSNVVYGVNTEVDLGSSTVTIPNIETVEARNLDNRCPDPSCITCNPEARQRAMNRQANAREEYLRNTFRAAEAPMSVDEMPF